MIVRGFKNVIAIIIAYICGVYQTNTCSYFDRLKAFSITRRSNAPRNDLGKLEHPFVAP